MTGNTAEAAKLHINNLSGDDIHYLYITKNNESGWGNDLLGKDFIFKNGSSWTVNIFVDSSYIKLRAVFKGGNSHIWKNIDISQYSYMTIIKQSDGSLYALYGRE